MAAKKRLKKQTLLEFRAWLEGVEELQPEGWAPNANQWRLIRDKIDGIKETVVEKVVEHPTALQGSAPLIGGQQRFQPQSMIPPAPILESSIPSGPVNVAPTNNPLFNPQGGKTQTPDIDTSDGNVSSSFV